MNEIKIALHMHTNYSDGNASHTALTQIAAKAGLDGIITTDHNIWVKGIEGYYGEGKNRVMLMVGEEIHDRQLDPPGNHMLAIGAQKELSPFGKDPQKLIDQIQRNDGLSFIAHPIEDPLERFGEKAYSWRNWDVQRFTGIELWNQMSEFKSVSPTLPTTAVNALFPARMTLGPLERTLMLWDELIATQKRKIVAVGGVDAHELIKKVGPFKIKLYPYLHQFKSITTHLLLPKPLTRSFPEDRRMVLDALRDGHCWVAYDLPAPTDGFRFMADNDEGTFMMGDRVQIKRGLTLQIRLPKKANCRLIKDGKVIKKWENRDVATHITTEPGVYRAEALIPFKGKLRGWIFSNPIYTWR
jgi:hypothetical protein